MVRPKEASTFLWLGSAMVVFSLASFAIGWGPKEAQANQSASVARLTEAIAALEARVEALAPLEGRVAALEAKLKRYEGVATPQEAVRPTPLLVSLNQDASKPTPMRVAPQRTASLPQGKENSWSGIYWGTSFGVGTAKSESAYSYTTRGRDTYTFQSMSDGSRSTDTSTSNSWTSVTGLRESSDWNEGALADLYLGASTHVTPRIVAGVQVEGALTQMRFESRYSGETHTTKSSGNSRSSSSYPGGSDESRGSSEGSSTWKPAFPEQNNLELDWMVSVIGRAGWLASPSTLLYGLGGWTYGHFDAEDLTYGSGLNTISDFGSHGLTVGGGIEKMLSPKWSLRAEYRYTNFAKESFSKTVRSISSQSDSDTYKSSGTSTCCNGEMSSSSSSGTGSNAYTNTGTSTSKGYFDNQMHTGRVGVTRYFDWLN